MSDDDKTMMEMESLRKFTNMSATEMLRQIQPLLAEKGLSLRRPEDIAEPSLHKFEILDEVLSNFLETNINNRKHRTIAEILAITKYYTGFKFFHDTGKWHGTVLYLKDEEPWLNIKLPNNGFVYIPKSGKPISRHKSENWIPLAWNKCLSYMPKTNEFLKDTHDRVVLYYEFAAQRIDIKFKSKNIDVLPNVLVTYERGVPEEDDRILFTRDGKPVAP